MELACPENSGLIIPLGVNIFTCSFHNCFNIYLAKINNLLKHFMIYSSQFSKNSIYNK